MKRNAFLLSISNLDRASKNPGHLIKTDSRFLQEL